MNERLNVDSQKIRSDILSRRRAMRRVGAVSIAAGLMTVGWRSSSVSAHEATSAVIAPVLVAWRDAWETLDPDAVAMLYTEDGVFEDVASGVVARGRDEITAALGTVMAGIAESRNKPVAGFRAGDQAVLEYAVSAVDALSGQSFSFRGVLVAELAGELIRHSREYYDVATILGQLGLLGGATPEAGTPVP